MKHFYLLFAIAILTGALGLSHVASAQEHLEFDRKIMNELLSPSRVEFHLVPLEACVEYLADYHGIPIVLDLEELRREEISPQVPITGKLENKRLEDVLQQILLPQQLNFMIEKQKLLITTRDKALHWQQQYAKETGRQ